ncbi:unnamed protein product [Pleuronectes platessa]|uniref:Uncharacterized protein n=1 Tax=Pleuronectes platessa TaxID=8262 RepID=A0A9N7VAV2_PLEPL|nr:unnamed protein product [Pleuronectes platessa]
MGGRGLEQRSAHFGEYFVHYRPFLFWMLIEWSQQLYGLPVDEGDGCHSQLLCCGQEAATISTVLLKWTSHLPDYSKTSWRAGVCCCKQRQEDCRSNEVAEWIWSCRC